MEYLAHSRNKGGREEPLKEHLTFVADRAATFARAFGAEEEAYATGILHDIGKYSKLFLQRLQGKVSGLDHWSPGACIALSGKLNGIAPGLAIQGHHIGLRAADVDSLKSLNPKTLEQSHPQGLCLTEPDPKELLERFQADGLQTPAFPDSIFDRNGKDKPAGMLDVRMLFSTLVDADFIETEAHFECHPDGSRKWRDTGPELQAADALQYLLNAIETLASEKQNEVREEILAIRSDLLSTCLDAAEIERGLYSLSAPTGSGKTLAMLAFALKHAVKHKLRRIIVVIPYLSIIEQTAKIYRDIFEPHFGSNYVLEHHSLAGLSADQKDSTKQDNEDEAKRQAELLSENWDAPVIVTTSVQFLESLFSNRPSACRKLHRIAGSVVLFDEVQTLPAHLATFTLAALNRLKERYGCTIVLSTATQPAFQHLGKEMKKLGSRCWQSKELAPQDLFKRSRRTEVHWPDLRSRTSWDEISQGFQSDHHRQVLCIVNIKRHALELLERLKGKCEGLFHLSTNMCPAHRQRVLKEVRRRLDNAEEPCRLISTQCVEAGVDVDFPIVYRAFGPLEAIAQAAGRGNRNGNRAELGDVYVFIPEESAWPDNRYKQAAAVTEALLKDRGKLDIDDPELFIEYYRLFYDLSKAACVDSTSAKEHNDAINRRDFVEAAKHYRLIKQDAINVLVPYEVEIWEALTKEVRDFRLTRDWVHRAREHSVNIFRPPAIDGVWSALEPVRLTMKGDNAYDWFIFRDEDGYDRELKGLCPRESTGFLEG